MRHRAVLAAHLAVVSLLACLATPARAQRPQPVAPRSIVAHTASVPHSTVARSVPRPLGGFLLGAVLGAAIGFVASKEACETRCDDVFPILYGTGVGAAIGGGVGLVIGRVTRPRVASPYGLRVSTSGFHFR